jgi:hypothetical protein
MVFKNRLTVQYPYILSFSSSIMQICNKSRNEKKYWCRFTVASSYGRNGLHSSVQTVARVNGQTYAFLAFVRLKGMPCLSCGHDKKEFTSLRMKHPK